MFVPLLLKEKYDKDCPYLLATVSLVTWSAVAGAYYPNVSDRAAYIWKHATWIIAAVFYALLYVTTASSPFCLLFTVFGAPISTLAVATYLFKDARKHM